jgi:hypothetical protein
MNKTLPKSTNALKEVFAISSNDILIFFLISTNIEYNNLSHIYWVYPYTNFKSAIVYPYTHFKSAIVLADLLNN